jgi:hypothetical protein
MLSLCLVKHYPTYSGRKGLKKFLSIGHLGPGYENISAQGPNRIGVSPYTLHLKTEIESVSETLLFYLKTRAMDEVQVNNRKHSDTGFRNETSPKMLLLVY